VNGSALDRNSVEKFLYIQIEELLRREIQSGAITPP
jgi:hypothetical protein